MKSQRLIILPVLLVSAGLFAIGCGSDSGVYSPRGAEEVTDDDIRSPGTFVGSDSTGGRWVFAAILTGGEETPPVTTPARGVARLLFEGDSLTYRLSVLDIENMTAAHIHLAPRGETGPVVATLYPGDTIRAHLTARFEGTVTADSVMTWEEFLDELSAGNAYVNVSTTQNPEGEIRGQIALLGGGGNGSGGDDHGTGNHDEEDDDSDDEHSGNPGGNGNKKHKNR